MSILSDAFYSVEPFVEEAFEEHAGKLATVVKALRRHAGGEALDADVADALADLLEDRLECLRRSVVRAARRGHAEAEGGREPENGGAP